MLLFNENAISSGGYTIENSLRFRSSASAYLSRTPASSGNRQIWTWSGWVKRGLTTAGVTLFDQYSDGNNQSMLKIRGSDASDADRIRFYDFASDAFNANIYWTPVFRDYSAWYHIMLVADTTQATNTDRIKLYVNGVQITSTSSATWPSLNVNLRFNLNAAHFIGQNGASGEFADGYMAEVNFIDGQALTPASFGEIDTSTNSWTAKEYTGTYGTNGFYLPFTDTTSTTTLVADSSGNGNNWTPNNISLTAGVTYDSMIDSPTNGISGTQPVGNYCTLNPIDTGTANMATSEGNLKFLKSGVNFGPVRGTFGVTSGKWYFEMLSGGGSIRQAGVSNDYNIKQLAGDNSVASGGVGVAWDSRGLLYFTGGSSAYAYTFTTSDVVMVAYDFDSGKVWFGKNGSWNTGDPATGTSPAYTISTHSVLFPFFNGESSGTGQVNFGQRPFTYTPPTGFKSLNTANLPEPTIKKSSEYMDVTTWTGTGATQSIVNSGAMQPDFVWIKSRNNAGSNHLYDALRGTSLALFSDATTADSSRPNSFTSFNINGFTLGSSSDGNTNLSTYTYVGWQWKEGTTPGFDIVTYTGTGVTRTVAHSLGISPRMIITKRRDSTSSWWVYSKALNDTGSTGWIYLNSTYARQVTANAVDDPYNKATPTSSVFTVSGDGINVNTGTYVSYLFAEVPGFSKFGSYTGNGSADGPFVFCGFRPRFVMIKCISSAGNNWVIRDLLRGGYNSNNPALFPNTSDAETSNTWNPTDILSNGFKIRATGTDVNSSGATYIFAAFAETPFKYSLAR